ncbi:hypothetical protein Vretimale_3881 [Volvox reticuliferus]|uniref:Dynamin N-terminal domain-containing protein n=1 Tax=Volvox reticuliferus TaxID=1737510 RepID=A0A8J4D9Q5_9CHLO|nr:hypothetical protein Vretifemale_1349 [Volvox reticuliferus]GIL98509.1 hypothetical protein Vretimale_3881 [Volvox reticuliferus]
MASTVAAASVMLASTRKSVDSLLAEIGGLLADLTSQERPTEASEDEENVKARRVIDVELQRFWHGYYELKRRHDENALSVAVLALTKSGKSTLLNALLGMEVLPMNNVPETARICRITHDASAREPLLRDATGKILARGEADVRTRLQQLNTVARGSRGSPPSRHPDSLGPAVEDQAADGAGGSSSTGSYNTGSGGGGLSTVLDISAPLKALEGYGPEFGRVTLLDTPGPNEAGEEQLKFQVERLLEGVDCVLYLLDYTKLKTAEEEGLFRRLRAINPQLVARLSSRLFFVINKVDASETSEGLDPEEVRNYVADLVTRQLGGAAAPAAGGTTNCSPTPAPARPHAVARNGGDAAGMPYASPTIHGGSGTGAIATAGMAAAVGAQSPFRLNPEQVLLLSCRNALMSRLVLSGRENPDAVKRFQRLAFGAFGSADMGQLRTAAGHVLEGSGILELESRVLSFLAAHAGSVKLLAAADDLTRLLAQVRNVALACRSCLSANVAALQEQESGLRVELAEATAAFEDVRTRTDAVQAEVVAEIKTHLSTLRQRLFTHIVQTLDTDVRAPPPPAPECGPQLTNRWHSVREKFLSMFTASCRTLPPQPQGAGPSLVPEARSPSREELQSLLLDLHDDVMGQIHSEVYDFWGVLEVCVASRHSELLATLNRHLAALSQRVEGAVSETLGVQLAPADIRLRPPSAEQLHSDVQELIEKGIRESTEKHIRVGARTTKEPVFRHHQGPQSLCRWGGYWVEEPRTRTVVETYTATVYSLKPGEIENHFIGLVDRAVAASEHALETYVGAVVERQLEAAKQQIRDYGDRYLSAMSAALAASSRGAECRSDALASVEGYLARLEDLLLRAAAAQKDAEASVPGGAAGLMDEVEVYDEVSEEDSYDSERLHAQQQLQDFDEQEVSNDQGAEDVRQAAPDVGEVAEEAAEVAALLEASCEVDTLAAATRLGSMGNCIPDVPDAGAASQVLFSAVLTEPANVENGDNAAALVDGLCLDAGTAPAPETDVEAEGSQSVGVTSLSCVNTNDSPATDVLNDEQGPMQTPERLQQGDALQPPSVAVVASLGASALLSLSAASMASSYAAAAPFDYGRAFEAMSSSQVATGLNVDEPLTTIPLTADSEGTRRGRGTKPPSTSRGNDTPRSGASEDWQLVSEEALDAPETACDQK